ncbi:MAG: RDD family protein [Verrucomicrobia bacterium]|nr:RDD family protein [Verrucomicrobiota bacterium]
MRPRCFTLRAGLLAACLLAFLPRAHPQAAPEANRSREETRRELRHGMLRVRSAPGEIVRVGKDVVIKEGETVGDVVVLMGDARIDGEVGDLVVILGTATLGPAARIRRELVVLGGDLRADAKAEVAREVFVLGGQIHAPEDALIRARARVHKGFDFSGFKWFEDWRTEFPKLRMGVDWVTHGLLLGRPLPPSLGWVWWVVAAMLFIHLLLAVIFPKPLQSCVDALDRQPVGSFFAGLLAVVLFAPAMLLLAFTGIGLLVVPFLVCALALAMLLGKVAVYRYAGQQVGRQLGVAALQSPLVALLAGAAVLHLLYMIPVLGFLAWGGFTVLGIGNAVVAAVGGMRRGDAPRAPVEHPAVAAPGSTPPLIQQAGAWPRAGFWRRLLAMGLDAMLVLGAVLLVTAVTRSQAVPVLLPLGWFVYHVGLWTLAGSTVGGMALRLKLVREDGRPLGFAVALVRALASVFSALVLFVGFFWAGWSRAKRSWHDHIAGTIVVKVPRGVTVA